MNQNKLSFESEGFNSTIAKIINGKWKSESLNFDKLNKFQVSFRQYDYNPEFKSYWVGTKISFSGQNASSFYSCIKTNSFHWDIFNLYRVSLSRFDLCYFQETKYKEQKGNLKLFMNECCQKTFARL